MTDWKKYTNSRLISRHDEDFYVIKPEDDLDVTPLFCRICDYLMTSHYDVITYKKFGCCDSCASTWAYPKAKEWSAGWRPDPCEIEKCVALRNPRHN